MSNLNHLPVQPTLFGARFQPLSQQEMVEVLEPHFPMLYASLMQPWEEFVDYRTHDKNFIDMREADCAVWLTMQAQIRARSLLDGKDGFRLFDQHQKLVIVVEERIAITIKKLTYRHARAVDIPKMERSNYPTPRNLMYWDQRRDAGVPDYPRVILGYLLLKEITEIRFVIAYNRSRTKAVEWAYAMPHQPALSPVGFTPQIAPTLAMDETEEKGFTISEADTTAQAAGGEATGTP